MDRALVSTSTSVPRIQAGNTLKAWLSVCACCCAFWQFVTHCSCASVMEPLKKPVGIGPGAAWT